MTICSWRTQSPERPQEFVCPHAKLQIQSAKCTTLKVCQDQYSVLCLHLQFERSIFRDNICSVTPIYPPHASLSGRR